MKFNNRHNELIKSEGGKDYWHSRSVAVVSLVLMKVISGGDFVLTVHRHPKSTFPNLWCMPCGFLDWDETAGEAAIRETWEEAGLNLLEAKDSYHVLADGIFKNDPWTVSTSPEIGSQNVIFHFASAFEVEKLPELSLDHTEPDELQDVKWIPIQEALNIEMAFGHNSRIAQFYVNRWF
jgi:8-oxo-dGTP pyrophosphatase MutT (NUDIX family)